MKKSIILVISALALTACHFLDFDQSVGYADESEVYSLWTRAEQSLTNVYSYLNADFGSISGAMRDCATDDAHYVWTSSDIHTFNNGSWSPVKTVDAVWSHYFSGIRAANDFITNMATADFSAYAWNADYATWQEKSQYWVPQARFLRSYFLFELARRYGSVPIVTKCYTVNEVNALRKNSFDEVIAFIDSECKEIAAQLPVSYASVAGNETGRITKGAALALRSRALLYAASPLFSEDSAGKWRAAALAAKEVMDMGVYSLVNEDSVNNPASKELILERRTAASCDFEKKNFPVSFEKGNTGTCPTQNLVDAFQTKDGYDVTLGESGWVCADPTFDAAHPYTGRDPRFYKTVIYDGAVFKGRVMACYNGGSEGAPTVGASQTGYYLKKYVMEDVSLSPTEQSKIHTWVLFRYAEIVLNYAEATNKVLGPDGTDAELGVSARTALNQIRTRALMPAIPASVTSKEAFQEALMREKRVEFALEGHRFWDVRRWKVANLTQEKIYGVNIVLDGDTKTYTRVEIEDRTWNDKKYLFPIPARELYNNSNLYPQNPGW